MTTTPTTRAADDDFLGFVAQALKLFGPNCTLWLQIPGATGRLSFPPDPSWSPPRPKPVRTRIEEPPPVQRDLVKTSAHRRRRDA
jgi:hypothetical protein